MKTTILGLYAYTDWATRRLMEAATPLTPSEWERDLLPGFGSLHHTFTHLLAAEAIWFARWQGESPTRLLSPEEVPTLAHIRERWEALAIRRTAYLDDLSESAFGASVQWTNTRGSQYTLPRWQLMLHCANHATHHRSEIAAMLSMLGYEPETTDMLAYFLAQAGISWQPSGRSTS